MRRKASHAHTDRVSSPESDARIAQGNPLCAKSSPRPEKGCPGPSHRASPRPDAPILREGTAHGLGEQLTDPEARLREIDAREISGSTRRSSEAQRDAGILPVCTETAAPASRTTCRNTSAGHSTARGANANPSHNPPRYLGQEVHAPLEIINHAQRPIPTLGGDRGWGSRVQPPLILGRRRQPRCLGCKPMKHSTTVRL